MQKRKNRIRLKQSKKERDESAQVNKNSVAKARETWKRQAPAKFRDLLDAEPEK